MAAAAATGYDLALLGVGGVRRRVAGRPPAELRWPLRRAFKALAYLATTSGMAAGRDDLEAAVWHEADEGAIRRNFHPTLSHLRRTLRGGGRAAGAAAAPLEFRQGVYRLNPAYAWQVDALDFEARCGDARRAFRRDEPERAVECWEEAWKLYGGPFLSTEHDPWITDRRDRCQRLHVELLSGLGDLYAGAGRLPEAVDALRAALIEDPLQERVALALMQVHGRQGRRDLVRHQYERLSAVLRRDLGVEPLTEITDEYHRLMG